MKNKNQYKQQKQWQGWPLEQQNHNSDWLDNHIGVLFGFVIIAGSIFCFICGVITGLVQPPLYSWVMRLLGLG